MKVELDDCWLWIGNLNSRGYAMFTLGPRPSKLAHRVAYEWAHGPIPDGLQIDHLCRIRKCVNPAHLEAVSSRENNWRVNADTCRKGHPTSTEARIYNGHRYCKACQREWSRRARERRRYEGKRLPTPGTWV